MKTSYWDEVRFVRLYCLFFSLVWAQENVPVDLSSPFNKTAIFLNQLGQEESREILSAEKRGNLFELHKVDGTLIVVPEGKMVAILPKLPSPRQRYTQAEAAAAIILLQKAFYRIPDREEVSPATLRAWEKLASEKSNYEKEAKKSSEASVENWIARVPLEESVENPARLEQYFKEGEGLLGQAGENQEAIRNKLEKVRQLMAMDFTQLDRLKLNADWSNVSVLLPIGILGILGLFAVWALLNISNFVTAMKMVIFAFLSRERTSRTLVVNVRSFLGIFLGALLLYIVFLATRVDKSSVGRLRTSSDDPALEPASANVASPVKRALYASMNSHWRWSNLGTQTVEVSAEEILVYLFGKVVDPHSSQGEVIQFGPPIFTFLPDGINWTENIKIMWVSLQIRSFLSTGEGTFSFGNPQTKKCAIGKLPLGSFVGGYIVMELAQAVKHWDQELGIDSRSEWRWKGRDKLIIHAPDTMEKKTLTIQSEANKVKEPIFKSRVSAEELASVFENGHGNLYLNRYVDVTGRIVDLSSSHRLGFGVANIPSGIDDSPDVFVLATGDKKAGLGETIKVKCVVKDPGAYFLDGRGDLYAEGQKPDKDEPLVKRGMEAHFDGGRVESFQRNTVEIYGARFRP